VPNGVFHQHAGRKIEVGPAVAQQLGYVADVHGGSHEAVSWEEGKKCETKQKRSILPQKPWTCQGTGSHLSGFPKQNDIADD
jgi:hypothetical protein